MYAADRTRRWPSRLRGSGFTFAFLLIRQQAQVSFSSHLCFKLGLVLPYGPLYLSGDSVHRGLRLQDIGLDH